MPRAFAPERKNRRYRTHHAGKGRGNKQASKEKNPAEVRVIVALISPNADEISECVSADCEQKQPYS